MQLSQSLQAMGVHGWRHTTAAADEANEDDRRADRNWDVRINSVRRGWQLHA
jgi:hypothetical protein